MAQNNDRNKTKPAAEEDASNDFDSPSEENSRTETTLRTNIQYIKKSLAQLRPSQELRYYRKKMNDFEKDVEDFHKEIDRCRAVSVHNYELEKELLKQTSNISNLEKVVSDLQESLAAEREQLLRLHAENEKLKFLLQLEKKEEQRVIAKHFSISELAIGPGAVQPNTCHSLSVSRRVPRITAMEHQESDNEEQKIEPDGCSHSCYRYRCFKLYKAVTELREAYDSHLRFNAIDKEVARREADSLRTKLQNEVHYLSERLKESNEELTQSIKDHMQWREEIRLQEVAFYTELNSMQSARNKPEEQAHETENSNHTLPGGGTDATTRPSIDTSALTSEISYLKEEITLKNSLIEKYQYQCATLQDELDGEKSGARRMKSFFKNQITKAIRHIETLKTDYKNLEQRRLVEIHGFHNAIKLIRSRLRDLERHNLQVNHALHKLTKPPVIQSSKKHTSAVNDTITTAENLRKGILEARRKIDDVEAALRASK
ncbi:coiled-coil domain-containing protein 77 isoform X2 [Anabrus simplex]|uniref:coiled-coil domain-containing protein 77 isoform X2 n=1 Tax=Anabrus simplex TaxID=316456 RepID=UPI0034DD7E8B